jgi:hypothetical protein
VYPAAPVYPDGKETAMDEIEQKHEVGEAYEPPEVVEVGSVASLTGQDGSSDSDDGSTVGDG